MRWRGSFVKFNRNRFSSFRDVFWRTNRNNMIFQLCNFMHSVRRSHKVRDYFAAWNPEGRARRKDPREYTAGANYVMRSLIIYHLQGEWHEAFIARTEKMRIHAENVGRITSGAEPVLWNLLLSQKKISKWILQREVGLQRAEWIRLAQDIVQWWAVLFTGMIVLSGLVVIMLAIGPKVRGFKPWRERWIFKDNKNP
jgi:hypothetical protein